MLKGFREFIVRGNVVDLAVGIVIGAGFQDLVKSFVSAFITPLAGLATQHAGNFNNDGFTISTGFGKVLFPYGVFITSIITFVLLAAVVYYVVVLPMNTLRRRFEHPHEEPANRECPECLSKIPEAARRCSYCTSIVPPLADREPAGG